MKSDATRRQMRTDGERDGASNARLAADCGPRPNLWRPYRLLCIHTHPLPLSLGQGHNIRSVVMGQGRFNNITQEFKLPKIRTLKYSTKPEPLISNVQYSERLALALFLSDSLSLSLSLFLSDSLSSSLSLPLSL